MAPLTPSFTLFCDADHAGNPDNGRSTSGYVLRIGSGAISWSSKLQGLVTQSTTEAEFIAAVDAGREIVWMRNLLSAVTMKRVAQRECQKVAL